MERLRAEMDALMSAMEHAAVGMRNSWSSSLETLESGSVNIGESIRQIGAEARRAFQEAGPPVESLASEMERVNAILAEGNDSWETYRKTVDQAAKGIDSVEPSVRRVESAVRGWGKDFTNMLTDTVMQGKISFSDLAESIIRDIIRIQIQTTITDKIFNRSFVGGVFGSLTRWLGGAAGGPTGGDSAVGDALAVSATDTVPAYVAHTGGIAGLSPFPEMRIDPVVFRSALRLHNGLAADEFPAILQTGEEVVSRSDRASILSQLQASRNAREASPVTVNLVNNTGTQAIARKGSDGPRWDGKKWVQDIILEAVNGGNESLMYAIAKIR